MVHGIVFATFCWMVKSSFNWQFLDSSIPMWKRTVPLEQRFEAVSYPSTSNCSSLYTCVEPRGTPGGPQGDPRGIPWMTPLRDARRLDGLGQMTSRKALHVRGNELSWSGLDWDLYMYYIVLLCTQSIPSENTMSSVRKLPQHEESLASVWDLDMLACCRPQHGPPNYDPCREIWPFMNGLFTIRLLL